MKRPGDRKIKKEPGLKSVEMLDECVRGKFKGIFILGEDPAQTDPDLTHVRKALESVDFLVVQDIFHTETTRFADVILPGASFAEKDGTFTNGERRIQRVRKAVTARCRTGGMGSYLQDLDPDGLSDVLYRSSGNHG